MHAVLFQAAQREVQCNFEAAPFFATNIHRCISETIQERRIAKLMSVLSGWKDDLSDFMNMVHQFNLGRTSS